MSPLSCLVFGLALALIQVAATGATTTARPNADDPLIEQRLNALAKDLRCVVCQNESLAESRAPLAQDLRREVRDLIKRDHTDQEILDYLRQRYGDVVLYRPPLQPTTYLLWSGPALFLGLGVLAWLLTIRRRQLPHAGERVDDDALREATKRLRARDP